MPVEGQFTWKYPSDGIGQWCYSGNHELKGIPDCKFSIKALYDEENWSALDGWSMNIVVQKTMKKAVKAVITVSIAFHGRTVYSTEKKELDDWTCESFFRFADQSATTLPITIICAITWYEAVEICEAPPPSNIHDHIKPFLLQSSLSDFKIVIGGDELPAHKLILGAYSPVFLSMFDSDMKEAKENRIVIEDIKVDIMKHVLSFMYTGSDENLDIPELAMEILVVAERYDIKTLKNLCEYKLAKRLEVSNVLEILDHADDHNAGTLKDACFKFILQNKQQIVDVPYLDTLCDKKPRLMRALIKDAFKT